MGCLLRALWRASSARRLVPGKCLISTNPPHRNLLQSTAPSGFWVTVRGISSTSSSWKSSIAGTFSEGKLSITSADDEYSPENEESEDEDPDVAVLLPKEVVPVRVLCQTFVSNPSRSAKAMVEEWEATTKCKFTRNVLITVFGKLWGKQRNTQAHRMMAWVLQDKPIALTSKIYQRAIKAAQRVGKLKQAWTIFREMPAEHKTPAVYTTMVSTFCNKNMATQAEEIFESFTPTTAQPYNQLILMYLRMEQDDKAVDAYERMRKAGIRPTDLTFFVLAKNSRRLGIEIDKEEAEEVLEETLSSLDAKRDGFNAVINVMLAYAYIGDLAGIKRAWQWVEGHQNIHWFVFAAGVEAFGQVGDMTTVYNLNDRVSMWKSVRPGYYPSLIRAYVINGKLDRAVGTVNSLKNPEGAEVSFGCYNELIAGYLAANDRALAVEKTKEALEVCSNRTKPSYVIVSKMLEVFKETKDVKTAEALLERYQGWRAIEIYNKLLEVYIAAKAPAPKSFEGRLTKLRLVANSETKRLLSESRQRSLPEAV